MANIKCIEALCDLGPQYQLFIIIIIIILDYSFWSGDRNS